MYITKHVHHVNVFLNFNLYSTINECLISNLLSSFYYYKIDIYRKKMLFNSYKLYVIIIKSINVKYLKKYINT